MNPRGFLIRGLLAGLLAGVAAFAVAYVVGEPNVNAAISLEEAGDSATAADTGHSHDESAAAHSHDESTAAGHSHGDEGGTVVSRANQSTWGLATGTLVVGVALGGLVALGAAGALGRIGRFSPVQSTALVAAVGYVAVALVPFLKYPANPPAVGQGDTIGQRTVLYFVFLGISVLAAYGCTVLASRLYGRFGALEATAMGVGAYVASMAVVALVMPAVNEVGSFPGDVLWSFRISSILTLTALWAVLGFALSAAVGRLHREVTAVQARREFAASL